MSEDHVADPTGFRRTTGYMHVSDRLLVNDKTSCANHDLQIENYGLIGERWFNLVYPACSKKPR